MSFAGLSSKTNITHRTTNGERSIIYPSTGKTEIRQYCQGCPSCTHQTTHNATAHLSHVVDLGETRHTGIAENQRYGIQSIRDLNTALWLRHYTQMGFLFRTQFNVGYRSGMNCSQFVTYEILEIDGDRMKLYGTNPRQIGFQTTTVNPSWPDDPTVGRLTYEDVYCSLPPGAICRFCYPSSLTDRLYPIIKSIEPPATNDAIAEFWATCSCSVSAADDPWDLSQPPGDGKYYVDLYWYQLFPDNWPNVQVDPETQYVFRSYSRTYAELYAEEFRHWVKNTEGGETRVLYPDMGEGLYQLLRIWIYYTDGTSEELTESKILEILETTQEDRRQWKTILNFGQYYYGTKTVDHVVINVWVEATASDSGEMRLQFASRCANCQTDPSGSWITDEEDFCTRPSSSKFAYFKDECWQPECDKFCLGWDGYGYQSENMYRAPSNLRNSEYWTGLWSRTSWILRQMMPGVSTALTWSIERPSGNHGPSVEELLGGFRDEVPTGKISTVLEYFTRKAGVLEVETDESGNESIVVHTGAFYRSGTASSPIDATSLTPGSIPNKTTFSQTDQLGATASRNAYTPVGATVSNLNDFDTDGSWAGCRSKLLSNMEYYLTGISETSAGTISSLDDEFREVFE